LGIGPGTIHAGPNPLVESPDTTVQAVRAVILGQVEHRAVKSELAASDSIAEPPNGRAEESFVLLVAIKSIVTQNDICTFAAAVRGFQGNERRTEADHYRLDTPAIGENVPVNSVSAFRLSEIGNLYFAFRAFRTESVCENE
jgi:hypothetical protein